MWHLNRELTQLRKLILQEGALVEEAIDKAIRAFHDRNLTLANEVIEADSQIDTLEIDVEEECLKILALHQPVAADLRFVVAVLKLNNDLERMGDLAESIARRARFMAKHDPVEVPPQMATMAEAVRGMVRGCLDALVNGDVALARQVCASDDQVDALKREIREIVRGRILLNPPEGRILFKLLDVPRHLERIADLATNVAEDVIYMVQGDIIRHQRRNVDREE